MSPLNEIRIVLLGVCGVGKSATGNAILDRETFKEISTRVSEVQRGKVDDQNISVIDTPGFFNTKLTDEELQNEMMKSLSLAYPGPHVFLLIINLQRKFKEEEMNLVKQIKDTFGEESSLFTMILFIGREKMSKREWIQFTESEKTKELLNCFEGRYHVINSKTECDTNQIKKLLKNIKTMVKNNGGQHYNTGICLKTAKKLKEQRERKKQAEEETKQEEFRKRPMEIEEKRDSPEQKIEMDENIQVKIESRRDVERNQNNVKELVSKTKDKHLPNVAIPEDLMAQLKLQHGSERQRWELHKEMTEKNMPTKDCEFPSHSSELRIVLLGKNGSENSAVGNMILGRTAFKEIDTRVSEVQKGRVEDQNISVINTPGFFNPELTDEDLQNEMMKSLTLAHPGPHVFLLIVRPDTFTEDDVGKILKKTEMNFGAQVFKFTLVLFIRKELSNIKWMAFTCSKKYQELIGHCKGKYHVINSDTKEITTLVEKITEVVKQNNNQCYNNDNYVKAPSIRTDKNKERGKVVRKKHVWARFTMERNSEHCVLEKTSVSIVIKPLQTDLRIVMVGKSGAGKSATGNTILGIKNFEEEMASESVTTQCETHQKMVEGRNISVTDTPGLFDTSMSEEMLKSEIERCVYMSAPGPHVFLLVIRLDVRFTEEEKNTVKWIQENFSADAMNYAMVLFTRGDQLEKPIEDFLKANKPLKDVVDKCKAGYHVFNNKDKNQAQVTELLEKLDRLMKENGGEHYTNEMYQEAQRKIEEENKRKREEEEKRRKEEEEMIRNKERERLKEKAKMLALNAGVAVGAAGAVAGSVCLAATPAVIIPAVVLAGSAALTGGTGGKLIVDKFKSTMQKKKTEYNNHS